MSKWHIKRLSSPSLPALGMLPGAVKEDEEEGKEGRTEEEGEIQKNEDVVRA